MRSSDVPIPVLLLAWQGARAGIERHLATLIRTLPDRFAPTVAFLSTGGPIADELAAAGVPVRILGMRRAYDPVGGRDLLRLARAGRFRLVHDHSTMAAAPIVALGLARIPIVVTEHLAMAQRRLDQRLSYRLLSRVVDTVIANSSATHADLLAHGIAAHKLRLIHPGVLDVPLPSAAAARAALADVLALSGQDHVLDGAPPLVAFVGRLEVEKGCHHFVAMAARVAGAVPAARFVILGTGSRRPLLAAAIESAGLSQRVVLAGEVADVERLYPAIDVLVSTSERETFGLAILEAMWAGTAVAAFDVGGVAELVAAGAGEVVARGDVATLATVVVGLLRDRARRAALGEQARARVRARFGAADMAREVAAVYDEVLAARAARGATRR